MAELRTLSIIGARLYDEVRDLCHRIKEGDLQAIESAASYLVRALPPESTLIPVPGHDGKPGYTLDLALAVKRQALKAGKMCHVADMLRSQDHPSLCELKRQGEDISKVYLGIDWTSRRWPMYVRTWNPSNGHPLILVDNVVDTGKTARECLGCIRQEGVSILAVGNTFRSGIGPSYAPLIHLRNHAGQQLSTIINLASGAGTVRVTKALAEEPDAVIIDMMTVHETVRRNGIGNELLLQALMEARRMGAKTVRATPEGEPWIKQWLLRKGFSAEPVTGMLIYRNP